MNRYAVKQSRGLDGPFIFTSASCAICARIQAAGNSCFDRILLNGLIQPFQQPERVVGFFNTYRQLYPVSRNTLRGIAEQFQAWLKPWAGKRSIPVVEAPQGRRDDFVDPYFHRATPDEVVVILKAREPARIMTAVGDSKSNRRQQE